MSDSGAYRMVSCPFCGSEIRHVESRAKSFDPPRLYHEWQHIDQNPKCWIVWNVGTIVGTANETGPMQKDTLDRWNRRVAP